MLRPIGANIGAPGGRMARYSHSLFGRKVLILATAQGTRRGQMRRREFNMLPGGAAALLPRAARARPSMRSAKVAPFIRRLAVLSVAAIAMVSCSPEDDVTNSIHHRCATDLYASYNPKVLDQCVTACIKCDHGNRVTCSTSCTLKGAR